MPEPTTMATSSAVPTASALAVLTMDDCTPAAQQQRVADSGRAAAAHSVLSGHDGSQLTCRHLDVAEHGVDLPRLPVGSVDPHLVLHGIAARNLVLGCRGQPFPAQPGGGVGDLLGRAHLDTQVIETPSSSVTLDQHQLERRVDNGEVARIPGDASPVRWRTAWSRTRPPCRCSRRSTPTGLVT